MTTIAALQRAFDLACPELEGRVLHGMQIRGDAPWPGKDWAAFVIASASPIGRLGEDQTDDVADGKGRCWRTVRQQYEGTIQFDVFGEHSEEIAYSLHLRMQAYAIDAILTEAGIGVESAEKVIDQTAIVDGMTWQPSYQVILPCEWETRITIPTDVIETVELQPSVDGIEGE